MIDMEMGTDIDFGRALGEFRLASEAVGRTAHAPDALARQDAAARVVAKLFVEAAMTDAAARGRAA